MPLTIPSKFDLAAGLVLDVVSFPVNEDVSFDSYLLRHNDGSSNHTLTLVLRIHLKQAETFGWPVFPVVDWDKTLFLMRPWPTTKWMMFQQRFLNQCRLWNDRFWLIPPAGFSKLDVKVGGRTLRPNIYCHLFVALEGGPGRAHRTITVVNLDPAAAAAAAGVPVADLDSSSFRSDSSTYDSFDVVPRRESWRDDHGRVHRVNDFRTIVHEIGHALGLDHTGQEHNDPFCTLAIFLDANAATRPSAGILSGGFASLACYGELAPARSGANVMGSGTSFDETNARPWRERLATHINEATNGWTVSMTKRPPVVVH
jgi:hypothetical protein